MISKREDHVLKAFTGLEGGVVASGSTCGVVTGGALGLAMLHDNVLQERGIAAEAGVLSLIGEYVRWFEESYGSSFCRDRTGVDFSVPSAESAGILVLRPTEKGHMNVY